MLRIKMKIERLIEEAKKDEDILALILFGSRGRGEETPASDFDICIVLYPGERNPISLSHKRLRYLKMGNFDVHIYQQLPIFIRKRVLKEGKVLLCKDEDVLYEVAFRTAKAFEDFKHIYNSYLEEVARG
jgi:predicted nucleotidyltransferase